MDTFDGLFVCPSMGSSVAATSRFHPTCHGGFSISNEELYVGLA